VPTSFEEGISAPKAFQWRRFGIISSSIRRDSSRVHLKLRAFHWPQKIGNYCRIGGFSLARARSLWARCDKRCRSIRDSLTMPCHFRRLWNTRGLLCVTWATWLHISQRAVKQRHTRERMRIIGHTARSSARARALRSLSVYRFFTTTESLRDSVRG